MRVARNIALFGAVGLVLSLIVAGLASVAPSIFGWLTVPFWLMPALANVGAHDPPVLPLFLLSAASVTASWLSSSSDLRVCATGNDKRF
jgi:hypothetical protein